MLLAYLDESHSPDDYYITALIVVDVVAIPLTKALDEVVEYAQDTYGGIASRAELHAYPLVSGTGDWTRLPDIPARVDVYQRAIAAIAAHDVEVWTRGVGLAGLRKKYGTEIDPHGVALTFVLERVQWSARDRNDVALVIADEVRGRETAYRGALRQYQETGTWGWRAVTLDRIADTMHFAPSSESRLLQAADLVSYSHRQTLRVHKDARAQAFYTGLWNNLLQTSRVKEASSWAPQV